MLRSEDGKPLATSNRVRIYRAFGERVVEFRGRRIEVETERILP
ncbi:MAG: hypothetical protein ACP5U2_17760 [Bryobacteraceae bacterium]